MSENRSKRITQLPITQDPQISGSTVIVQDGVTYQTSYENIKNNIFPIDQEVTSGSTNPVASSGIYQAIDQIKVDVDQEVTSGSTNPVASSGIYQAIDQIKVDVDQEVTSGSTNPVASSGIYQAIDQSKVDVDQEVTSGSTNPVASSGIYQAIDELNVPNADKVGDNTTPINTDRTYFYNTISGWFYVAWEKIVRLLRGGSGAFAQPVYLTNIDSDITGYKVLSYNNDVDLSEVSISTDDDPVVYLYPDGLGLETLPNGPYFFSFRARLSSTVGDTTLRITSFVRDSLGNERDLFTTQTNDINSSSYVDIGIRVLEPSYVVNPSERYGIRVSAITTHATTKTVTYQVGDGYSAYFTTPIALRHELLRGRDELCQHPAKSITVSETPIPIYSGVTIDDTLQEVSNKVLGVQQSKLEHTESTVFPNPTLLNPGDEFWDSNTMTLYKVYDNNGTNIWVQDKNTSFHQYKVLNPIVPSYENVTDGDALQEIAEKVAGMQLQSGGKVNALGSITGINEVNLSNGTFITATLTGAIELTFTGLPTAGYVKDFVLHLTNIETITFPTGTKFAGGVPPVVIASPYMFVCSVNSTGVVTVYSLIDNIIVPV